MAKLLDGIDSRQTEQQLEYQRHEVRGRGPAIFIVALHPSDCQGS
jgi:hypothetical protein